MNTHGALVVSLGCLLTAACVDNLEIPETNVTPVAVPRLLDDDRVAPTVMFTGAPLELTLDGSRSKDPDGTVAGYRWLSATQLQDLAAEGGGGTDAGPSVGRWRPEGEPIEWPDDIEQPTVTLPAPGQYSFTLWVTDDRGRISDSTTLTIEVTAP